jgi:hypothetical protein
MIEKIKRELNIKKATKGLKGHGFIKYINGLPKQGGVKIQSTILVNGVPTPKSNPSKQYVKEFWSGSGCTMDRMLYEQVVNAKING